MNATDIIEAFETNRTGRPGANEEITRRLVSALHNGATAREAIDQVLGEGTYVALAEALWIKLKGSRP